MLIIFNIFKVCYDLGCYYFPKELYNDAWRHFQKACLLIVRCLMVFSKIFLCCDYRGDCTLFHFNLSQSNTK